MVGARCAGSPIAMLLARRGHRVLVVDAASEAGAEVREGFAVTDHDKPRLQCSYYTY